MKKLSFLLPMILCLCTYAFGQEKWKDYSETYPSAFIRDSTKIGIVICVEGRNDDFRDLMSYNRPFNRITINDLAKYDSTAFIYTFSETPAYFFVRNINIANAGKYQYRVTETGNKVIVPWSDIRQFDSPGFGVGMGKPGVMGVLGSYKAEYGHRITVEVRRKSNSEVLAVAISEWAAIKPVVQQVFTIDHMNEFFNELTHGWMNRVRNNHTEDPDLTKLKSTENSLIFLLEGTITKKSQMDYELVKNGKVVVPWRQNEFDNNFIWLKNLPHGKYQLRIRYNVQPEHVGTCDFIIKPAWYQGTVVKIIAGSLTAVFFALIAAVIILFLQKRRNAIGAENRARLQTELQVIRSQLNPHFIFNALNSIQGLINKKDVLNANLYLSEFASLLRNTLINNEKELLPLNLELGILETYIKLEQLRFNFKYEIKVDKNINPHETELPSLLLQPLLENAIKHGISELMENGKLAITFQKRTQDMEVIITDNGKGFDETLETTGFGLKLTRNRITLLNNMLTDRSIVLTIKSAHGSTTKITLTFINWFREN